MLTSVPSSDLLLQNLVFECTQQGLHNDIIVCSRGESYKGGSGGCAWKLDLKKEGREKSKFLLHNVSDGAIWKTTASWSREP